MIVAVVSGSEFLDTTHPSSPGTEYAERKARAYLANFLHCVKRTPGSVVVVEEADRGPAMWALEFCAGKRLDYAVYESDGTISGRRRGKAVLDSWGGPAEDAGGRDEAIARSCASAGRRGDIVVAALYLPQYPKDPAALLLPRAVWKEVPKMNFHGYQWVFKSSGAATGGRV